MRRLVGTALGLFVLGLAATSMAGPGGGWGKGPGMGMNPYGASYLGLTAEQTQQLQSLREAQFKEMAPLQEKLFSRKQELRLLWANPNPDQGQILAKQKEISDLQAQIEQTATKHRLEARKILTPEQQQKLAVSSMGRGPGAGSGWGRGRMARGW